MTAWKNCEIMVASFTKNKATAQPCRVCLGFFMPVNTLFFQNLRQEESRKEALHALMEKVATCPDRKMKVNKLRIGEKIEGTGGGQNFDPHESTYPVQD